MTAVEAIENVKQSVDELALLTESLDNRIDDVPKGTDLIESIAEQTNMFALNTNIEAARASGESEGFAVVANEMKSLADETQNRSAAVERTTIEITEDMACVQMEMKRTKTQLETGQSTTADAAKTFAAASDIVEDVDMSVNEIVTAADDDVRTIEEVVDAITDIADHSRDIVKQNDTPASQTESRMAVISGVREQLDDFRGQTGSLQARLEMFDCEVSVDN